MNKVNSPDVIFACLLMILASTGYFLLYPGHNLNGDYALYVRQAQSIINGDALQVREVIPGSCCYMLHPKEKIRDVRDSLE